MISMSVFTASTLLFLSGIPLLEQKSDARHGSKEEYREYKKVREDLFITARSYRDIQ